MADYKLYRTLGRLDGAIERFKMHTEDGDIITTAWNNFTKWVGVNTEKLVYSVMILAVFALIVSVVVYWGGM